jgi:hypothetical protein
MNYLSLVTQKTAGLRQVMSSSASTVKEADKLLDESLVIWIFSLPRLYPYCKPYLLFLKRKLN